MAPTFKLTIHFKKIRFTQYPSQPIKKWSNCIGLPQTPPTWEGLLCYHYHVLVVSPVETVLVT